MALKEKVLLDLLLDLCDGECPFNFGFSLDGDYCEDCSECQDLRGCWNRLADQIVGDNP